MFRMCIEYMNMNSLKHKLFRKIKEKCVAVNCIIIYLLFYSILYIYIYAYV